MTNRANPGTGTSWPICVAALLWLATSGTAFSQTAPPAEFGPVGEWLVADRVARIRIVDCNGHLWGVVAWEAKPGTDTKNPDPKLRNRPTLGMPILLDMVPTKPNRWEGNVYNSQNGHTYSANISLSDPNTLRIQGCVLGFLCGGENWTRVETGNTVGRAPAQAQSKASAGGRKSPTAPATPADDVCSRVLDPAGLSHERRLK